jgi:hypothetical protein
MLNLISVGSLLLTSLAVSPDIGWDSGLWRAAFQHLPETEQSGSKAVRDPIEPHANADAVQQGTAAEPLAALVIPEPVPTDVMESIADANSQEAARSSDVGEDGPRMSGWDQAAVSAIGGREKSFKKDGPSVVSIMVAIVGLIVVCGAYLSGRG